MSNVLIAKNRDLQQQPDQQQPQAHQHSVTCDYENGENLCKLCGTVVQDRLSLLI